MNKLLYYKPLNSHIRRYRKEVEEQLLIDEIQASKNKVLRAKEQDKINKAQAKNELENLQLELKRSMENPAETVKREEEVKDLIVKNRQAQTLKDLLVNLSDEEFYKALNQMVEAFGEFKTKQKMKEVLRYEIPFYEIEDAESLFEVMSQSSEMPEGTEDKMDFKPIKNVMAAKKELKRLMREKKITKYEPYVNILNNKKSTADEVNTAIKDLIKGKGTYADIVKS